MWPLLYPTAGYVIFRILYECFFTGGISEILSEIYAILVGASDRAKPKVAILVTLIAHKDRARIIFDGAREDVFVSHNREPLFVNLHCWFLPHFVLLYSTMSLEYNVQYTIQALQEDVNHCFPLKSLVEQAMAIYHHGEWKANWRPFGMKPPFARQPAHLFKGGGEARRPGRGPNGKHSAFKIPFALSLNK